MHGIAITPLPESERKPGFVMKPFFGVEPVLMDEKAGVLSAKTDRYIPYKFTRYIIYMHAYNEFSHKNLLTHCMIEIAIFSVW